MHPPTRAWRPLVPANLLAGIVAVTVILAACGGANPTASPAGTVSGAAASATPAEPTATPAISLAPSGTAGGAGPVASGASPGASGASPSAAPSIPHDVPDLEAVLPTSVAGTQLTKGSFGGARAASILLGSPAGRELLNAVVGKPEDLSIANAAAQQGSVSAVRVVGQDPGRLLAAAVGAQRSFSGGTAPVADVTLGGKAVKRVGDPSTRFIAYLYSRGDTFFSIQSGDPAFVEDALRQLPAPDAGAPAGVSPEPSGPITTPSPAASTGATVAPPGSGTSPTATGAPASP